MANYPNIHNMKLDSCCIKTIDRINNRLKAANMLSMGIGTGVFANMFGPSPSSLNTIAAVQQTDFSSLAQAMAAVPKIKRQILYSECENECFTHLKGNNVKLEKFWKGMMDALI